VSITQKDIDKALKNLDEDAKVSFLAMSREDQLLVVLSMEGSNSNRLAVVEKWQINFEEGTRRYRSYRESKENGGGEDIMSITQKMAKVVATELAKRFDFWSWFRDRILPTVITVIVLAILYMAFGGKIPGAP
jgi:hypothetical protein